MVVLNRVTCGVGITDELKESVGIHVVTKPIGPVCNLNCEHCFYL